MKNNFLDKIFKLFQKLSSEPKLGGFQITDSVFRYMFFTEDKKVKTFSVKLPPGVILNGKVKNEKEFLYYLNQLHEIILPNKSKDKLRIIVCLPSAVTYTQNYNIPNVGFKRIKEVADLNLETISPIPIENAYTNWQLVNETEDKYELLGAFANKNVVNNFKNLLLKANFTPMIFEFPSLSLSWTINHMIGPRNESFLVLSISGDGIDLFLLKKGSIYFDYYKSWGSIQGNNKKISRSDFDEVLIKEIRKVVNFTSSRFNEILKYVFIVAPGLSKGVKKVIEDNFQVQAAPLETNIKPLSPAWYIVLGSSLRGSWDRSKDRYINLGIHKVEDMFFKEQMLSFITLWRSLLIGIISIFLILMSGSLFLLKTQPEIIEDRLNMFNINFQETNKRELDSKVQEFNNLVGSVRNIKQQDKNFMIVLEKINKISSKHDVRVEDISFTLNDGVINMKGDVPSYEKVIDFKKALIQHPNFENVNMPFSKILTSEGNFVDFSVSFKYNLEK